MSGSNDSETDDDYNKDKRKGEANKCTDTPWSLDRRSSARRDTTRGKVTASRTLVYTKKKTSPPVKSQPTELQPTLQPPPYRKEWLPPGWEMSFDKKHRRVFYIDHNTKSTQWDPPTREQAQQAHSLAVKPLSANLVNARKALDEMPQNLHCLEGFVLRRGHLQPLLRLLGHVAPQWRLIGEKLNLETSQLDKVAATEGTHISHFTDMLDLWFKSKPEQNLSVLLAALPQETMKKRALEQDAQNEVPSAGATTSKGYTQELILVLSGQKKVPDFSLLDDLLFQQFRSAAGKKIHFTYLLLDPTKLSEKGNISFQNFVEAIFYVGEGDDTRPYQHLKDARKYKKKKTCSSCVSGCKHAKTRWKCPCRSIGKYCDGACKCGPSCINKKPCNCKTTCQRGTYKEIEICCCRNDGRLCVPECECGSKCQNKSRPKLDRIIKLWQQGKGVIPFIVFHGITQEEGFCREEHMIRAIGKEALTNDIKGQDLWKDIGNHSWRNWLGVFLLYKAYNLYLTHHPPQPLTEDDF